MTELLLNCPFCGNKPNYSASCQDGYKGYCSIYCQCGINISGYETKNEVRNAWNTRINNKKQPESKDVCNGLKKCCQEAIEEYKTIYFCDCDNDKPTKQFSGYTTENPNIKEVTAKENGYEAGNEIHACKCERHPDAVFTVRRLDEGINQCPRCGGIIVPKKKELVALHPDKVRIVLDEAMGIHTHVIPGTRRQDIALAICRKFGSIPVAVPSLLEIDQIIYQNVSIKLDENDEHTIEGIGNASRLIHTLCVNKANQTKG